MKTIIISRHAKSSWDNFNLLDIDRPLNDRGHRDAPFMAAQLKSKSYIPQYLISSPAKRAMTTAEFYANEFDLPLQFEPSLYHGDTSHYLDAIHQTPESFNSVALFGHNPGITYLANLIEPNSTDNIPTAGVIIAQSSAQTWNQVSWENCTLISILYPKK